MSKSAAVYSETIKTEGNKAPNSLYLMD